MKSAAAMEHKGYMRACRDATTAITVCTEVIRAQQEEAAKSGTIDCHYCGPITVSAGGQAVLLAVAEAHRLAHRYHVVREEAAAAAAPPAALAATDEERSDGPQKTLTARQAEVLRVVWREYDFRHLPVSAAFVAETLGVSHERVRNLFRRLNELGWLRSAGTPAIPTEIGA